MSGNPFARSPDAFFLRLDGTPSEFRVVAFDSPWGTTDEHLAYYKGTLIGRLVQQSPTTVVLVPKLDRHRAYPWPTVEEFRTAFWGLLVETSGWYIRCERDCDQEPISDVRDMSSLHKQLVATLHVCATGEGVVPAFAASARASGA
jgi:hypothetical protein